MTSEGDRQLLLRMARAAIVAHVTGARAPVVDESGVLARTGAAFVTLQKHGELRGCIGHLETTAPLWRVIPQCALAACSSDPRFPAVRAAELAELAIELSLLGPLEAIAGPQDVEVGRHGLLVERDRRRGLLLPQVAAQWRWDAETFLAHTCRKAGLPHDAWKRGASMWRFEAEVFGEQQGG